MGNKFKARAVFRYMRAEMVDNFVASYWLVLRHLPLSTGHSSIHSPVFEPLSGSAYSFSSRPTRRVAEERSKLGKRHGYRAKRWSVCAATRGVEHEPGWRAGLCKAHLLGRKCLYWTGLIAAPAFTDKSEPSPTRREHLPPRERQRRLQSFPRILPEHHNRYDTTK